MAYEPSHPVLDGVGFIGNLLEYASVVALGGSALLVFFYLWRKDRLSMDQEPAITMMQNDDYGPQCAQEEGSTHDGQPRC